ncbi:MAG: hypothetical protein ACP5N9_05660 [Candidatus Bilamarchaeum sp.]|jgi:hypothetical protein
MTQKLMFRVTTGPTTYRTPKGGSITTAAFAGGLPLICDISGSAEEGAEQLKPFRLDSFSLKGGKATTSGSLWRVKTREIEHIGQDIVRNEHVGFRLNYTAKYYCETHEAGLETLEVGTYSTDSRDSRTASSSRLKAESTLKISPPYIELAFSNTGLETGDHFNRDTVEMELDYDGRIVKVSSSFKALEAAAEFRRTKVRANHAGKDFSLNPNEAEAREILTALKVGKEGIDLRRTIEAIAEKIASDTGITDLFDVLVFNPVERKVEPVATMESAMK